MSDYRLVIEKARRQGYTVTTGGERGDFIRVECAGSLDVCLDFIRENIERHEEASREIEGPA